jgi:hypothetical protein
MSDDDLREQLKPFLEEKKDGIQCGQKKLNDFLARIRYVQVGSNEDDMSKLAGAPDERGGTT